MRRRHVSKHKSVKSFKRRTSKTDSKNLASPLRGGWRL